MIAELLIVSVICDSEKSPYCHGNEDFEQATSSYEDSEIRKDASRSGWFHIDGKDICPACRELEDD